VQLEATERARVQSAWILTGALDWARLILREDSRPAGGSGNAAQVDHLGEPWAVPLAEARLSSFLAADKDNNADSDLEAFLSGSITDAQARYNLRNLFAEDGKPKEAEVRTLERLCESAGLSADVASRLVEGLRLAWSPVAVEGINDLPLAPLRLTELSWVGIDSASIAKLAPFVIVLPAPTPVNANTASREVLVAVLDGLDLGTAERLLELRQRSPFGNLEEIRAQIGQAIKLEDARVSVGSSFFEVVGRMRLDQFVIEELSLVERRSGDRGAEVVALHRERRPVMATP
jgi:general secretion pathway protein K